MSIIQYDEVRETDDGETVYVGRDGDSCFAVRSDFTDLQESLAGFGSTYEEAIADLVKQEQE